MAFGAHTANDTPSTTPSAVVKRARVRAEDLPQPFVAALGEQVQVDLAERGQEAVRVGDGVHVGRAVRAGIADLEPVVDEVR